MTSSRGIRALSADLVARRVSSLDLVERGIEAAERTNQALKSFITIAAAEARAAAIKSDQRRQMRAVLGPLDGIPFGAKDVFQTRGIRTTAGSRVLQDWIPDVSAAVIQKLDAAGAILLGKTNLHEFSYGATGQNQWAGTVANPYDPNRLAGGSSGGSAAAVAVGAVPFSLGTDTGGSVRVPAALCGIAGFKPTFGRISLEGVVPFCWSLDHVGVLAATVDDLIAVAEGIRLFENLSSSRVPLRSLRVGIVPGWFEMSEAPVRRGFEAALSLLEERGASTIEIQLPDQAEARTAALTIQLTEALTYHGPNLRRAKHLFGADVRSGLLLGQFVSAESYIQCKRLIVGYQRAFAESCARFDVLLTPACPVTAPSIGVETIVVGQECMPIGNALTVFTSFFNLVGVPAVVIPAGTSDDNLPVGVQVVGCPGDDERVLAIACAIERALAGGDGGADS